LGPDGKKPILNQSLEQLAEYSRKKLGIETLVEELSGLSTIGIGGPAVVIRVKNDQELMKVVTFHAREGLGLGVIGGGSNVLFPDGGLLAAVVRLDGDFKELAVTGNFVSAGAGTPVGLILEAGQENGLTGLEFLAGLPGTVGGAVMGNAGSKSQGLAELIEKMELITPLGENLTLRREEIYPVYRSLNLPESLCGSIVKRVTLALRPSNKDLVAKKIAEERKARREGQPIGRSLGCVFKNPQGQSAGRLIDLCGLKGQAQGGAQISQKHANFILNIKRAKASDVLALAKLARSEVLAKHRIKLLTEIKIWDEMAREVGLS
jgi:UDP-N-acetylmuramate dehydrogenase